MQSKNILLPAASLITAILLLVGPAVAAPATVTATAAAAAGGSAAPTSQDRDEWHIRKMHDKLKVSAAQEPLWEQVAAVMRSNDEKIDALGKERHDHAGTMTAVEDLRSYAAITDAHATATRTFIPPFEALYQAMSAEQQANADRIFRSQGRKSHKKAHS